METLTPSVLIVPAITAFSKHFPARLQNILFQIKTNLNQELPFAVNLYSNHISNIT
jgi:hypothetical protein